MIKEIKIPRWIQTTAKSKLILHGFADASDKAYAAVLFAIVDGNVTIVAAKTIVNPIKNRKTIPKLELFWRSLYQE